MLSIRLNEKWQAIIATAGTARRSTTGRNGPTVRDPAPGGAGSAGGAGGTADAISGGLGSVLRYQHERVVRAFHVPGDDEIGDRLRRVGERQRFCKSVLDPIGEEDDGVSRRERDHPRRRVWFVGPHDARRRHEPDPGWTTPRIGVQEDATDVA